MFLPLVLVACAFLQGDTGQLNGTVVDANGAVILGASVKLTSQATSQVRELVTGDSGDFAFTLLPPGRYKLEVSATNFRTVLIEDARVNITQTTSLVVHLEGVRGELRAEFFRNVWPHYCHELRSACYPIRR